mgnify:FL=1
MARPRDLTIIGEEFGLLKVIGPAAKPMRLKAEGKTYWCCLCRCGLFTVVERSNLLSGNTNTCGCAKYRSTDGTETGCVHEELVQPI